VVSLAARVSLIKYPDNADAMEVEMRLHDATVIISATASAVALEDRRIRAGTVNVLKEVLPLLRLGVVPTGFHINFTDNITVHYPPSTPTPTSFKPLILSVYKTSVVTDRAAHISLVKRLRAELHVLMEERQQENERRGSIHSRTPRRRSRSQ